MKNMEMELRNYTKYIKSEKEDCIRACTVPKICFLVK